MVTPHPAHLELETWNPPENAEAASQPDGRVDARGANWSGCALGPADLSGAKLCRTDLRGTDLSGSNLEDADLRLARYDTSTRWPDGFDPCGCGAVGPGAQPLARV